MLGETNSLPIGSGAVLTLAAYAGISVFATGPEVADREIERSLWQPICTAHVEAEIEASRQPEDFVPDMPNPGDMICSVYPELAFLCDMMPDPGAAAKAVARHKQALEDERIARAAAGAGDVCSCAVQVYIEEERLALALYAGSGRIIVPQAVQHRDDALSRALRNPTCAGGLPL